MKHCPFCGEPAYALAYHSCSGVGGTITIKPTQEPPAQSVPDSLILVLADKVTPGEATRICIRIQKRIDEHCESCIWCQMLKEQGLMCIDGLQLRDSLKKWEYHTLIKVDRKEEGHDR
jgi:hypothetical protein